MNATKDPGLGTKFKQPVKRLMNEDGSYNIKRIGGLSKLQDFYKFLIDISWFKFLCFTGGFYLGINMLFTVLYLVVGMDQLVGVSSNYPPFYSAFFFSVQTFTTLGYGSISPSGIASNLIATVEAFVGLMSFALATGLLYGRFSKPKVKILFTKNVILTPFDGGKAMMFKLVNLRKNVLLNTKVDVLLILDKGGQTDSNNKEYFRVKLENDKVNFFPLTWTIVHKINEKSPLYGMDVPELTRRNAELVILVETFDETYGQMILQKHSYAQHQWKENVKFEKNFRTNQTGQVELFVNEIDNLLPVD